MKYGFYGAENAFAPAVSGDFPGIDTPRDLYAALLDIWCSYSCTPRLRDGFSPDNPTLGQCAVTAFLAQDIFGGKVFGIPRPGGNFHCYNVSSGCTYDLTSEQFGNEILVYQDSDPEQLREVHFQREEKRQRYEFLREKLRRYCHEKASSRKISAVIFDMDGVIFDSERPVLAGWQDIARKYSIPDIETPYYKCIGVNSVKTREIFLDFYGADFPYDKYKAEQSHNFHAKYDGGKLPLMPYIRETLELIRSAGISAAVASSTRSAVVLQQIADAGLDGYFSAIIGGDMISRSKPFPDIFLEAAKLLGASPENSLVIEDSFNGIRAAYTGGFVPVMVPDMVAPDCEMQAKADYIFGDLSGVMELIKGGAL